MTDRPLDPRPLTPPDPKPMSEEEFSRICGNARANLDGYALDCDERDEPRFWQSVIDYARSKQ